MEQLYVVWHSKDIGWKPTKAMTKEQAELFAKNLEDSGYKVKVAPRLKVTTRDITEG